MTLSWDLKISIGLFLAFFTFLVFNKRFRALLARLWKKAPNVYVLLERLNKDFEDSERVWVHADEDDGDDSPDTTGSSDNIFVDAIIPRERVLTAHKVTQVSPLDFHLLEVCTPFKPWYFPNKKPGLEKLLNLYEIHTEKSIATQTLSTGQYDEEEKALLKTQSLNRMLIPKKNLEKKNGDFPPLVVLKATLTPVATPESEEPEGNGLDPFSSSLDLSLTETISKDLQLHLNTKVSGTRHVERMERIEQLRMKTIFGPGLGKSKLVDYAHQFLGRFPFHLMELKNVGKIDFSLNAIAVVPTWVFNGNIEKTLTRLDLAHNHIFELPKSLGNCTLLKSLNLADNHLQCFPLFLIDKTFSSLARLDLSMNSMIVIPSRIHRLRALTHLDLGDNWLTFLPYSILHLKKGLKALSVEGNRLMYQVKASILAKFPSSVTVSQSDDKEHFRFHSDKKANAKHKYWRHHPEEEEDVFTPGSATPEHISLATPVMRRRLDSLGSSISLLKRRGSRARRGGERERELATHHQETRGQLLFEFMANELSFLRLLNLFHKVYYVPLVVNFKQTKREYRFARITKHQRDLFLPDKVTEIADFQRRFYTKLRRLYRKKKLKMNLPKLFNEFHSAGMPDIYIKYRLLFQICILTIGKLSGREKGFKLFLETKQELPISEGLSLEDLLSLPLSRIAIYRDFFFRYLKSATRHKDYRRNSGEARDLHQTIKTLRRCYGLEKENIYKFNNKYRVEELELRWKMNNLYANGHVLLKEDDLDLEPSEEVARVWGRFNPLKNGMSLLDGKWKELFGDLKEGVDAAKDAVTSVFTKNKDNAKGVVKEIMSTRIMEQGVKFYLFEDRVVFEYTQMVVLFGKVQMYKLSQVKDFVSRTKKTFTMSVYKKNKTEGATQKFTFTCPNEGQTHLWMDAFEECMETYRRRQKMNSEEEEKS